MVNEINKHIINDMIAQATDDENEKLCVFLKKIIDSENNYDKVINDLTYISDDMPEEIAIRFASLIDRGCSSEWVITYIQFMQEKPTENLIDYYDVLNNYIDGPFENIFLEALENTSDHIEFAKFVKNFFDNKEPALNECDDCVEVLDAAKNLEIENSELTHKLHDVQNLIIQKDNEIEDYIDQLQKFREDAKVTQANYIELQRRYSKKAQDNDIMRFKLDRSTSLSERLKKGNNTLIEEQKRLMIRLEQLERDASSHEENLSVLHQQIDNLIAEKEQLETCLSDEKTKNEELENKLASIPSDIKVEDIISEEPGFEEKLEDYSDSFDFPEMDDVKDGFEDTDEIVPEPEEDPAVEESKGYPISDNCAEVKKKVNIFAKLYYKYYEDRFIELNDASQDIVIKKKVVELNNLEIVKYVKSMLLNKSIAKVDIYKLILKKASMDEFVALNNGV